MRKLFYFSVCLIIGLGINLQAMNVVSAKSNHQTNQQRAENFDEFLKKFTGSAKFQYSRIKFPLPSSIIYTLDDGQTDKEVPFSKEKWALLNADAFKEQRIATEDGAVYVMQYTEKEPTSRVFQSGYEESENDLVVEFALIDGKWYVVDCMTGWFNYDLNEDELKEAISAITQENKKFIEQYP